MPTTVRAGINVALVKYWGKRDAARNLPDVGSLSLTLEGLGSTTTVAFEAGLAADRFELDGEVRDDGRVTRLLDGVREVAGLALRASVVSHNSVPTASGLASSASGAAALGLAAWRAAGLSDPVGAGGDAIDRRFLELVRVGSGSAPRSLLGGLVELDRATTTVRQLLPHDAWDLRMVVASPTVAPKAVSSRAAMERCRSTSPYYAAWRDSHDADLVAARAAIEARDLAALGPVMERSTMKMHACMLSADPPIRYWRPETVALLDAVEALRPATGAWYTMDAGPHVKVLCATADVDAVVAAMSPYAEAVRVCAPGPGAEVVG